MTGFLQADVEVLAAEPVDRMVDADDGPRTAIDALVRARRPGPA